MFHQSPFQNDIKPKKFHFLLLRFLTGAEGAAWSCPAARDLLDGALLPLGGGLPPLALGEDWDGSKNCFDFLGYGAGKSLANPMFDPYEIHVYYTMLISVINILEKWSQGSYHAKYSACKEHSSSNVEAWLRLWPHLLLRCTCPARPLQGTWTGDQWCKSRT